MIIFIDANLKSPSLQLLQRKWHPLLTGVKSHDESLAQTLVRLPAFEVQAGRAFDDRFQSPLCTPLILNLTLNIGA